MAPAGKLADLLSDGEEEWATVFERLVERFPDFTAERVLQILRDNKGHGGQAASILRDLSGTELKPVEPDDVEHVRTLLSSPAMFSHACKDHFRMFDVNGDGALQWTEIVSLVNSLYENFGLAPPREGNLRAFFEATDTNHDGELSEKEFKHFFECFLRYAFFDIQATEAKKRSDETEEDEDEEEQEREQEPPAPQVVEEVRPKSSPSREAKKAAKERERAAEDEQRRAKKAAHAEREGDRRDRRSKPAETSPGKLYFQCVAPHGVSFRKSTDYQDRMDRGVPRGEAVQALEVWIRTPHGWLPVALETGDVLFEPCEGKVPTKKEKRPSRREDGGPDASPNEGRRRERDDVEVRRREREHAEPPQELRRREDTTAYPSSSPSAAKKSSSRASEREKANEGLRPGEEEWQPLFERLESRFPTATPSAIADALRATDGHAGQAAGRLREITKNSG